MKRRWIVLALLAAVLTGTCVYAGEESPSGKEAADELNITAQQLADSAADLQKENYGYHSLADFTAETLDGSTFTPDDLKDYDLTIVYFWSATCGYCVEELPALAELKKELPANIQLITWCPDGGFYHDTVVKMLDRRGLDAVTIISGDGDIDKLIKQLWYTPMALFLDEKGDMLREPLIGAPEDPAAAYREIIEEILDTNM